jgi:hypothetical protein
MVLIADLVVPFTRKHSKINIVLQNVQFELTVAVTFELSVVQIVKLQNFSQTREVHFIMFRSVEIWQR